MQSHSFPKTFCPNCQFALSGWTELPPSPVPDILCSNVVPSLPEATAIYETISNVKGSMTRLDDEINQVQNLLSQLLQEREEVATYLDQHKALLSPARLVPPEIVSEIFHFCVTDEFVDPKWPLVLGQVCHRWREMTLALPRLWCSLRLNYRHTPSASIPVIETWLARSKTQPFRLFIERPLTQDIANLLVTFSHRLHNLQLFFDGSEFSDNLPKDTFQSLEVLHVSGSPFSLPQSFACAPRLRRLTMIVQFGSLPSDDQWTQLTDFECLKANPTAVLRVLNHCTKLERCRITLESAVLPYNGPHITPRRLFAFHIAIRDLDALSEVLHYVTLPSLQELEMSASPNPRDGIDSIWNPHTLVSLIERSSCSLDKLSLRGLQLSKPDCVDIFNHITSVKELSFSITPSDVSPEDLISTLLRHDGQALPLPNLQRLQVDRVGDMDNFVSVIKSRWRLAGEAALAQASRLKRLQLYEPNPSEHGQWLNRLREMEAEGLIVALIPRPVPVPIPFTRLVNRSR